MTEVTNVRKKNTPVIAFGVCVIVILAASILCSCYQSNFGSIDVQTYRFPSRAGVPLVGKLYRPVNVDNNHPAPAVLALHGFNNDKNVMRPVAIELAKVGFVVLALDQMGDGDSGGILATDSYYTAGNGSYQDAFKYLQNLSFVNPSLCGIVGHSLGSIRAHLVGLFNPTHKAVVEMTFGPQNDPYTIEDGNLGVHNLLRITASWEEFGMSASTTQQGWYDSGQATIRTITGNPTATWNTNYGDFAANTARRWAFIAGATHAQLTVDSRSVAETVAWMLQSLKGVSYEEAWAIADPANQTYVWSESLGLLALLATLLSILPLGVILLRTKPFEVLKQPRSQKVGWNKKQWWIWATCGTIIGGVTYLFFTSFYVSIGTDGLPFGYDTKVMPNLLFTPLTGIGIATGFMSWFLIVAAISAIFVKIYYSQVKKKNREAITPADLGGAIIQKRKETETAAPASEPSTAPKIVLPSDSKFKWSYLARTVVLVFILYAWMYVLTLLVGWTLNIELQGVWTFAKPFTQTRAVEFWVYLWPTLLFFLVTGGIYLFGEMKLPDEKSGAKTQFVWWIKGCYVLLGGLVAVILIQYVPMWFGAGPLFNGTYDPNAISPVMIIALMGFIPFAALLIFQMVYFFRHTRRIYLGSIIVSVTVVWFQMVGLVIYF